MIKKFFSKSKVEKAFLLEGKFKEDKTNELEKEKYILDNPEIEISSIYLGSMNDFDINKLKEIFQLVISNNERIYQIDPTSFATKTVKLDDVIKTFIYTWYEINGKKFNLKTNNEDIKPTYILTSHNSEKYSDDILIASQMCEIRMLQNMAPNILTINEFSSYIKKMCANNEDLSLTILDRTKMKKLGMNLILGVNDGSAQEAKIMVIEYKGKPSSKEKISFVGKGIMFDSGGYNLKTPVKYMIDMKFDMSGAAISVLLVDTIAKLGIKKNVSCVVPLTDNMIDSKGQVPESIWTSMSGKTVEVANTDAEGRLVLADALTYASKELNSSLIIDLATLTGTMFYALGRYTGVWSTNDRHWEILNKCAIESNEKIWRMPLDEEYIKDLSKGTYADTLSCYNVASPDSSVAATWLKQFVLDKEYIHLDIASTADLKSKGQAPMFRTLIEFVKNS